jgi:hypothetical protein
MKSKVVIVVLLWFIELFAALSSQGNAKMAAILDQKNYLEELNRHLK